MTLINKLVIIFYLFGFGWSTNLATVPAVTKKKRNMISCSSRTNANMTKIHCSREAKLNMRPEKQQQEQQQS